jgi:Ion transport protein.
MFAVLRALRVLRVLRLVSIVPSLRRVVDGLGRSIPGIFSVAALLGIIFYIGSVMATSLFGAQFPRLFGSLESSLFTLFQLMTLDDWANITRDVADVYPLAPLFFIVFVAVSALTVLNLVVAVIVDAMQQFDSRPDATAVELAELRAQVRELTDLLRDGRTADDDAPTG